jgi:ArsR family transcriptional regulator
MESMHGGEEDPTTRPAGGNGPAVPTLNEAAVASAVQRLGTPGNETQYVTLGRIARADDDGLCVCGLEATLGVSRGAVSRALSRLFDSGLVDRRTAGRWRYYTATDRAERLPAALEAVRGVEEDQSEDTPTR